MRDKLQKLDDLILKAETDLEVAQADYLRAAGWAHTSSTPGCFLVWEKKMDDGRVLLLPILMAIAAQRRM